MNKIIIFLILTVLITFATYFFLNRDNDLTIGINTSFPPFEYIDPERGGEILGFDIELAKIVAKDYGKNLDIKIMGFLEILPAIQKKDVDIGMSTFTITEERKELVDFSIPYYETSQVVLVRKDDQSFYSGDIKEVLSTKILSSRSTTTGVNIAKEIATNHIVVEQNTWEAATNDLLNKKVDAVFIDNDTAKIFASQNDNFRILDIEFEKEYYGIAVQKGNTKLLKSINKTIQRLIDSGEHQRLVEEYIYTYPVK